MSIPDEIRRALDPFGGFLRCEVCGHRINMLSGDAGAYCRAGWPKCCGRTMHWWTQRQIDAGEAPA